MGRSGLRVSRTGLGTSTWGRDTDADEAAAQLVAFVDAGGTLVDTSPAYTDGAALAVLGGLVADVVPRSELVLSVSSGSAADSSRRTLLTQLDAALAQLGTDHVDLWRVGGWDPGTPVTEVADTLEQAVRSGRARYVGVQGHAGWQLATLAAQVTVAAVQVEHSLLVRAPEAELLPAAEHHGAGVLAVAPLARGVLTGKYRDGTPADSRGASPHLSATVEAHRGAQANRVVEAVVTAADGLGTSPLAVALAWVRDRQGVAGAVVGGRDNAQLAGVLAVEALTLPAAIRAALDDVSAV